MINNLLDYIQIINFSQENQYLLQLWCNLCKNDQQKMRRFKSAWGVEHQVKINPTGILI